MKKLLCCLLIVVLLASCSKETAKKINTAGSGTKGTVPSETNGTLSFSGYTWTIKDSGTGTSGPGPNRWKGANAFVDANGYLHLKLSKNTATGVWECAEVTSQQKFGYGTYQWKVEGAIDNFDKYIVLGLFNYSGVDGYDEMDIEYAKWGIDTNPWANYTVYPKQGEGPANFHNATTFTAGSIYTTNRFKRTASAVIFKTLNGFYDDDTNLAYTTTCASPSNSISTLSMPVHMNIWLFQGHAPTSNNAVEIIIHEFKFTPL
ncbi:MAG: glycoside hydrolase family 16 protein [Bacteroidota bacterium]